MRRGIPKRGMASRRLRHVTESQEVLDELREHRIAIRVSRGEQLLGTPDELDGDAGCLR